MKTCANIYKSGREYARLTQEQAAELLGVSQRRLSDYENEVTPPDDIVARMAEIYNYSKLEYLHLKHNNLIGHKVLPEIIDNRNQAQVMLMLHSEHKKLPEVVDEMIEILKDGVITSDEKPYWNQSVIWLSEFIGILMYFTNIQ